MACLAPPPPPPLTRLTLNWTTRDCPYNPPVITTTIPSTTILTHHHHHHYPFISGYLFHSSHREIFSEDKSKVTRRCCCLQMLFLCLCFSLGLTLSSHSHNSSSKPQLQFTTIDTSPNHRTLFDVWHYTNEFSPPCLELWTGNGNVLR